jgi:hypothetical protein
MPRPPLDYAADLRRRILQADERMARKVVERAKMAGSYRLLSGDPAAFASASWQALPVALDVSHVLIPSADRQLDRGKAADPE